MTFQQLVHEWLLGLIHTAGIVHSTAHRVNSRSRFAPHVVDPFAGENFFELGVLVRRRNERQRVVGYHVEAVRIGASGTVHVRVRTRSFTTSCFAIVALAPTRVFVSLRVRTQVFLEFIECLLLFVQGFGASTTRAQQFLPQPIGCEVNTDLKLGRIEIARKFVSNNALVRLNASPHAEERSS